MAGPRDYNWKTIDPDNPDGMKVTVIIPHSLYNQYYKYNPVRYENLNAAKHVLDYPERILYGVRKYNKGGWCYAGRPRQWCIKPDIFVPFPQNLIFTVYMNINRVLFEYGAELVADNDPECPAGWDDQDRFSGGLKWKSIS